MYWGDGYLVLLVTTYQEKGLPDICPIYYRKCTGLLRKQHDTQKTRIMVAICK
jgi:hypothetical protein